MKKSLLNKLTAIALASAVSLGCAAPAGMTAFAQDPTDTTAPAAPATTEQTTIDPAAITQQYMDLMKEEIAKAKKKAPKKLKKKEESKDVKPIKGGLFKTSNGVECRSVNVKYGDEFGEVYSFGVELYNNTKSDKSFDPTKFMIETKSGKLVYPCLMDKDKIKVKAELKRAYWSYQLYDHKDLKLKQKASIYYDGVFIKKVTVKR